MKTGTIAFRSGPYQAITRLKQPTGMVPHSTLDERGITRACDGSESLVGFDI